MYKSYESISDTDGPELLSDSGSGVRMPELRTVTFEVMLAQPKTPVYDPGFKPESGSEDAQGHDIDTETFHTSLSAKASSTLSATSISLAPHCWTAHERILDVMMPDRSEYLVFLSGISYTDALWFTVPWICACPSRNRSSSLRSKCLKFCKITCQTCADCMPRSFVSFYQDWDVLPLFHQLARNRR